MDDDMILDQHWAREAAAGALNARWPTSGNSFFDKMAWLIEGAPTRPFPRPSLLALSRAAGQAFSGSSSTTEVFDRKCLLLRAAVV